MSREDDVELIRVGGPATYSHEARGPVTGYRITDEQGPLGVLWYAEDPAQDAGGVVYPRNSERAANASVHWFRLLREAKAQGLAVRDAVTGLVAAHGGPAPWGATAEEPHRWSSLGRLSADVHLSDAEAPARAASAPRVSSGPRPARAEIDAALRRYTDDEDLPPDVRSEVERIDGALLLHPVPEPLVVLLATSWAALGLDPHADAAAVVRQPAYLLVRFATPEATAELQAEVPEVLATLRVPAGVPATYSPTRDASGQEVPRLLLARRLGLRVTRKVEDAGTTHLFGELLLPESAPLPGG